jgi:hypothetical protein
MQTYLTLLVVILGCGCGSSERPVERVAGDPTVPADASHRTHPGPDAGADELAQKHMTFDEKAAPINHTELLWGDYVDKQGKPAIGWHSHDPVVGNAR